MKTLTITILCLLLELPLVAADVPMGRWTPFGPLSIWWGGNAKPIQISPYFPAVQPHVLVTIAAPFPRCFVSAAYTDADGNPAAIAAAGISITAIDGVRYCTAVLFISPQVIESFTASVLDADGMPVRSLRFTPEKP